MKLTDDGRIDWVSGDAGRMWHTLGFVDGDSEKQAILSHLTPDLREFVEADFTVERTLAAALLQLNRTMQCSAER